MTGGDMGHKNGHNSVPRASPTARIWHAPSYHISKGFSKLKGTQFQLKYMVLKGFGEVIKAQNPISRAAYSS